MNEIATRELRPSLVAGSAIASIVPRDLDEAFRLSTAIHQSGMAPYGVDTPQKIMIAMLAGLELGLPPMQAVQSVAVINNRPCVWGDALIGVVRSKTVCLWVKEWIECEGDKMVAYCETHRKGEPEPVRRSFSVEDAKKAGLWQTEPKVRKKSRDGGFYEKENDSPWFKYPKRMLQMRARAWCLRDVYADVTKGMQVREEVEDFHHVGPEHAKNVTPERPLSERLAIARQEIEDAAKETREGFDQSFVARETAALSGAAPIEQEPSDEPSPASIDEGAEVSPPPSAPSELAGAADLEDGVEADHPDTAAPSSDPLDERAWLIGFAKAIVAAIGPDEAVVVNQSKGLFVEGLSEEARKKVRSATNYARAACRGDTERGDAIEMIAGIAGCEPKELA